MDRGAKDNFQPITQQEFMAQQESWRKKKKIK
jgi:hypothetical protein